MPDVEALDMHQRSLRELAGYLVVTLGQQFTPELQELLRDTMESFQVLAKSGSLPLDARKLKSRGLRENILIAQNSLLLAFAYRMGRHRTDAQDRASVQPVDQALDELWEEMREVYELYFGAEPPYVSE